MQEPASTAIIKGGGRNTVITFGEGCSVLGILRWATEELGRNKHRLLDEGLNKLPESAYENFRCAVFKAVEDLEMAHV